MVRAIAPTLDPIHELHVLLNQSAGGGVADKRPELRDRRIKVSLRAVDRHNASFQRRSADPAGGGTRRSRVSPLVEVALLEG
jgi:hypothetical protein